jgi:hypothetical protein
LIISRQADFNTRDRLRRTPLDLVTEFGNGKMEALLK